MDLLVLLASVPAPIWAALSGGAGGLGTWLVGIRQVNASIANAQRRISAEAMAEESVERTAFRAALMADITDLRRLMKECESDRDALRTRVNEAEQQMLVLRAANEITERWLIFFKDRHALDGHPLPGAIADGADGFGTPD